MSEKEYIERLAAIELVKSTCWTGAIHALNIMPAADVEPVVRGEWIEEEFKHSRENWDVEYKCSACEKVRYSISNYCPNCGARMERSGSGE